MIGLLIARKSGISSSSCLWNLSNVSACDTPYTSPTWWYITL